MPTAFQPSKPGALTNDEILRYSRHLIMPEVGMTGQEKLKAAKVLCIGTGGLGAPLALYLAAAGVGTLGLVNFDGRAGSGGEIIVHCRSGVRSAKAVTQLRQGRLHQRKEPGGRYSGVV